MKFWFYCYDDEDTEVCFSILPDKQFLVDKIGKEHDNVHPKVLSAAYGQAIDLFIQHVTDLGIAVRDRMFVTAKDVPVIREALLEKGWIESLY